MVFSLWKPVFSCLLRIILSLDGAWHQIPPCQFHAPMDLILASHMSCFCSWFLLLFCLFGPVVLSHTLGHLSAPFSTSFLTRCVSGLLHQSMLNSTQASLHVGVSDISFEDVCQTVETDRLKIKWHCRESGNCEERSRDMLAKRCRRVLSSVSWILWARLLSVTS